MSFTAEGSQDMPDLPNGCVLTRKTPVFTEASVPPALLRAHRTAPGAWALIRVLEGRLLYRVLDTAAERVLEPGQPPGLVTPETPHEVAPLGPVRFFVEFYRRPQAPDGPAREGRA